MAGTESTETTDTSKTTDSAKTDDAKTTTGSATTDKDGAKDGAGKSSDADKKTTGDDDSAGLKSALQKERKQREALEKQIRDGELAKLPELERYKTLSDELTKENDKLKTENLQRRVAMELGLNWTIGKRITGDNEEEMRADGSELLKQFKQDEQGKTKDDPKNKTTNDARKTGAVGGPSMNDKLRALAGRQLK
jgi:hypothetical protein